MKTSELARSLKVKPPQVRAHLRRKFPREVDKKGNPWGELTPEICEEVSIHFTEQGAEKMWKEQHPQEQRRLSKRERIQLELEGKVDISTGRPLGEET